MSPSPRPPHPRDPVPVLRAEVAASRAKLQRIREARLIHAIRKEVNSSTVPPSKAPELIDYKKLYILVAERNEIDECLEFCLYHTKLRSTEIDPDYVDSWLDYQVCLLRKRLAEVIGELTAFIGATRAETLSTFDAMCRARIVFPILASGGCQIKQPSTPPTTP